jgi:hypothetical protein
MMTDTELKIKGFNTLVDTLGEVEAERFISLILREPFDYTKWQKHLFPSSFATTIFLKPQSFF